MDTEQENNLHRIVPIADQMVKALWLKAYATSETETAWQWSELGLAKIKQLSDIYTELGPAVQDSGAFWALVLRAAVVKGFRDSI